MRVGVTTPVRSLLPRAHAKWEEDAGLPEVVEIARALDRLGYHHLTCSEHVAIPKPIAAVRGGRYWDPLATLGYLAAHTAHPPGDPRARARLSPPARAGQALRHP